jgi:predicted RNase H-like HicB family nuclease
MESTIANTRGAIQVWLNYLRDRGRPIPDADAAAVIIDVDV